MRVYARACFEFVSYIAMCASVRVYVRACYEGVSHIVMCMSVSCACLCRVCSVIV